MAPGPRVAVVVGAHQRRQYLLGAVRSVRAQTLDRSEVEVVVTKDFADATIDEALAREGVHLLRDPEPRIGPWLRRAIETTTAPLLAFLDDDDRFEPERLARALQVFRDHPDVGFYRNRVRVIDADDRPLPADAGPPVWRDAEFDRTGPILVPPDGKADLLELAVGRTRVTFNSSTMVVRRELLDGAAGRLFDATQLPDLALFLAAAFSPMGLFLDDRRLTEYRHYAGNVTRRTHWLSAAARSHREGADLARATGHPDFERWLRERGDHFDRLYRAASLADRMAEEAPRREVVARAADYLRFLGRHPGERSVGVDVWAAEAVAAAYLVAPRTVGRIRRRRRSLG
jgi:Glycosyl transferase family 2